MKRTAQVLLLALLPLTLGGCEFACSEAAEVAKEEFGPRALLVKYEWFKDAAAQCEKKLADISVIEFQIGHIEEDFAGLPRGDWPRDVREQLNQLNAELFGIKASYNQLSSEYNAAMVKFNYKFTNVGDLPPGADVPLPREFKPYISK